MTLSKFRFAASLWIDLMDWVYGLSLRIDTMEWNMNVGMIQIMAEVRKWFLENPLKLRSHKSWELEKNGNIGREQNWHFKSYRHKKDIE